MVLMPCFIPTLLSTSPASTLLSILSPGEACTYGVHNVIFSFLSFLAMPLQFFEAVSWNIHDAKARGRKFRRKITDLTPVFRKKKNTFLLMPLFYKTAPLDLLHWNYLLIIRFYGFLIIEGRSVSVLAQPFVEVFVILKSYDVFYVKTKQITSKRQWHTQDSGAEGGRTDGSRTEKRHWERWQGK